MKIPVMMNAVPKGQTNVKRRLRKRIAAKILAVIVRKKISFPCQKRRIIVRSLIKEWTNVALKVDVTLHRL
jgi:hypothetical protein